MKFASISTDFLLTGILTEIRKEIKIMYPDHSGKKKCMASANYPNPQIKNFKTDTTYIQVSYSLIHEILRQH